MVGFSLPRSHGGYPWLQIIAYRSFSTLYPTATDNKRLLSTAVDCCRLQTFIQRLGLDRHCIFVVDFVWGKPNDKTTGKRGFGLSHILIDHGDEIKDFNIDPIDFILMIMNFGKLNTEGKKNRIYLEGKEFRLIVTIEWYGKSKQLLLTAFDLRPISRKNPQRAKEMKKAPKR